MSYKPRKRGQYPLLILKRVLTPFHCGVEIGTAAGYSSDNADYPDRTPRLRAGRPGNVAVQRCGFSLLSMSWCGHASQNGWR